MTVDRPRDLELCPKRLASTTSCGARMITDTLASAHAHMHTGACGREHEHPRGLLAT